MVSPQFTMAAVELAISEALKKVSLILDNNREPEPASAVDHSYCDKFTLAEFLSKASIAAILQCLDSTQTDYGFQLNQKDAIQLQTWAASHSLTLTFTGQEKCELLHKKERKIETVTNQTQYTGFFAKLRKTDKTVTTVTDYTWDYQIDYHISISKNNETPIQLCTASRKHKIVRTDDENPPRNKHATIDPIETSVGFLFNCFTENQEIEFVINRADPKTFTPRRNPYVSAFRRDMKNLQRWAYRVHDFMKNVIFPLQGDSHGLDVNAINANTIFIPVIPLFEDAENPRQPVNHPEEPVPVVVETEGNENSSVRKGKKKSKSGKEAEEEEVVDPLVVKVKEDPNAQDANEYVNLSVGDLHLFLYQQKKDIQEKEENLVKLFPDNTGLITRQEAVINTLLLHIQDICFSYCHGVAYIEGLLRQQVVAAIGKELSADDFNSYMVYHNRKLFKAQYQPKAFCYAIRRPGYYPEGTITIDSEPESVVALPDPSSVFVATPTVVAPISEPISTIVSASVATVPMKFALNASTKVSFTGERYIHGWMPHKFSNSSITVKLTARAKQFSSYIILVGRILSATEFDPIQAAIVHNKDEVTIPLLIDMIPTRKEFKAAVESISPTQKQFSKQYRAMQLESTLFGVCVLQIKPLFEAVLHLPTFSLTKEIQLTQHLGQLFMEYQLSSDLLGYDPDLTPNDVSTILQDGVLRVEVSQTDKVNIVKHHVKAARAMLTETQEEEIKEVEAKIEYLAPPPPPPCPVECDTLCIDEDDGGCSSESECDEEYESFSNFTYSAQCEVLETCDYMQMSAPSNNMLFMEKECAGDNFCFEPEPIAQQDCVEACVIPMEEAAPIVLADEPPPAPDSADPAPNPDDAAAATTDNTATAKAPDASELQLAGGSGTDYTQLPNKLDKQLGKLCPDSNVRPTIINLPETWSRRSQKSLLSPPEDSIIDLKAEKDKAFDLLDSLTRSGEIIVQDAALHVLIASTHCFDRTLVDTLIRDNVNPIDKVEQSTLVIASLIHQTPVPDMIQSEHLDRVHSNLANALGVSDAKFEFA